MNSKEFEEQIIEDYRRDERMMILVFAQWCVNHNLNPEEIYRKAYPNQTDNQSLKEMLELTVPKEEAGAIENQTVLGILSLFGNDDLASVVTQEIKQLNRKRK